MKSIKVKKSNYFSRTSKVFIIVGSRKIQIKGFGLYTIQVDEGENISASQLWTGSKTINFEKLEDGTSLIIKPKLTRLLALIILLTFIICSLIFYFTGIRWSFLPLIPFGVYILIYLTILKQRYLILEEENMT